MSAIDTFNWLMKEAFPHPDEATKKLIEEKREELFSLRSEDESLRFVDGLESEIRQFDEEKRFVPIASARGT